MADSIHHAGGFPLAFSCRPPFCAQQVSCLSQVDFAISVHPAAEKPGLVIDVCKTASDLHKSTSISVTFGKDANFAPEFCPERAREGVTPITAGTLAKVQNNVGLEEYCVAPGRLDL
jgi:hypothetical protein